MRFSSRIIFSCPVLVVGLSVLGQSGSPFEPPGSGKPKSTPKIAPVSRNSISKSPISSEVEMRGYFKLGDEYFFSIHQKKVGPNSKNKKSEWRKKGEDAFGEYRVRGFDPDKEELTLERNGRTENITLHVSQVDMRPPGSKSKSPRGSLSLPRPVTRKVMPPKPSTPPPLPAAITQSPSSNPVQPPSTRSSAEGSASNSSPSSANSQGFVPRPFIPRRQTSLPAPPTSPESPTIGGSTGGSGSPPGNSTPNGDNLGLKTPFSNVKSISSGGGSPSGEIDLSNLPPPPPPPNILPPGPPPDIEPSLQDR